MKALYRGGGSIGIIGAARFGMLVGEHPAEADWRVLSSSKCNIGPKPKSLGFEMIPWPRYRLTPQIEWLGETDVSANDLVGYSDGKKTSAVEEAAAFLIDFLAGGPAESEEVCRLGEESGIARRTLHRAKNKLGVRSLKKGSQWYWQLPTEVDFSVNGVATDVPF